MNIGKLINRIVQVSVIKTLYFNFHYLPISQALHIPIIIYKRTKLSKIKGEVLIKSEPKFGLIKIGHYAVGTLDMKYNRTIWQNEGKVIFDGIAHIGSGTKIGISKGAVLSLGEGFCITGGSSIVCNKEITFGKQCLLSWDILIMDTDFHHIIDAQGRVVNNPKPIRIGDRVWIGCRNTILKGVSICNDVVIAAGSKIIKDVTTPYSIIGGIDRQRIIKEGITWQE